MAVHETLIGGVTIAMIEGEPALVVWRADDFWEALEAGHDMGLPVTTTWPVAKDLGFDHDDFGPDSAEAADMEPPDIDRERRATCGYVRCRCGRLL